MTTLIEQIEAENNKRIQKIQNEHFDWISKYEKHFTHFVTLTFHPQKIRKLQNEISNRNIANRLTLLELQKKSFRCFLNRLRKNLYGNSWQRFGEKILCIGILEGLHQDGKVHYHCLFGVEQSRHEHFSKCVRESWKKSPLSGHQIDVQLYRHADLIGYITKQAKYINRESIDWDNVLISEQVATLITE